MAARTELSPGVRRFIIVVDRMTMFISKHWLLMINVVLAVLIGLPLLAPVLMHLGYTGPAQVIYSAFRLTCHELAYRSYFLFGPQPVYTIDQLRTLLGVENESIFYWSNFVGNAQLGYKVAWCERDIAIYGSMLVAGMVFGLLRSRVRSLHWRIYVLFVLPMAIDGFWQLFTSPEYWVPFLPQHESTWFLRTITGVLFGVGSIWLVYPYVEEAMREVLVQARTQYERARAHAASRASLP